jgi:hypothetical protein
MTTQPPGSGQSLQEALGEPVTVRMPNAMEHPVRRRFMIAYFAIAIVAGIAIGSFAILLARPDTRPTPSWSSFQPHGSDDARVKQIADRVARPYRLGNGNQLAIAIGGRPTVDQIPVSVVAIRPDTSKGQAEEDDVKTVAGADTVQYTLCGLGTRCTIASGVASNERGELLTREAIELSLYTFRYIDSAKAVTVFLPPLQRGKKLYAPPVLFLRRGEVSGALRRPVSSTFSSPAPRIGGMSAVEKEMVSSLALPNLYTHEYQQAPDGTAILVLTPRANTTTGQ